MQSVCSITREGSLRSLSTLGAQAPIEIPPKTVLFERDSPASGLYCLERGIMQLHSSTPNTEHFVLEVLLPGDVFGEECFMAQAAYGASATVLVRSSVRWIPPLVVSKSTRIQPDAWLMIADRLVRRHRRALQRFNSMCRQSVSTRILNCLLELSPWCPGKDGLEASLPLSQASLAQLVYSTRETVSTKLNRLAEDGLVVLSPSRIGIPSSGRLRETLDGPADIDS